MHHSPEIPVRPPQKIHSCRAPLPAATPRVTAPIGLGVFPPPPPASGAHFMHTPPPRGRGGGRDPPLACPVAAPHGAVRRRGGSSSLVWRGRVRGWGGKVGGRCERGRSGGRRMHPPPPGKRGGGAEDGERAGPTEKEGTRPTGGAGVPVAPAVGRRSVTRGKRMGTACRVGSRGGGWTTLAARAADAGLSVCGEEGGR